MGEVTCLLSFICGTHVVEKAHLQVHLWPPCACWAHAHISICTHQHMHTSAYAQVKFKNATDNFKSILNANFQFKNNYFTISLWLAFTQRQTEYSKHHPTCPLIKRSLLNIPAENYKSHQFCNIPSKSKSIFLSILIKL